MGDIDLVQGNFPNTKQNASNIEELNIESCIGMEFDSIEKVKEFYNSFAKNKGFGVRVRSTKPRRAVLFCCSEGKRKVKSAGNEEVEDNVSQTKRKCSTLRTGCEASLVVARICYDIQDTVTVDINLDSKIAKYDCQLYEFMGILCRHILVIFQAKGIVQIPEHFILQRWTKEANKGIEATYTENNFPAQSSTSKILRRVHAQQQPSILVDMAEESEEMYKFIISELCNTHKSAIAMKENSLIVLESNHTNVNEIVIPEQVTEAPSLIIGDPHISHTKGRRKDGENVTQNC